MCPGWTPKGRSTVKKFVAFWLSLALTLSLAACSGGGDSSPRSSEGGFSSASVSLPQEEAPAITSLTLDCKSTIQVDLKDTLSIPVEVLEEGADLTQVEFTSSDPNVLTFTYQNMDGYLSGVVSPIAEGTAEIYASAGEVKSQIITVTVIDSERIAAEEAAKKAAEEEAARKAAEEAAAQQAAQEAAAQQQAQSEASESQGRTVYITPTGKRYHYDNNCNGGTYIPSTMDEALSKGLTPCKKCAGG